MKKAVIFPSRPFATLSAEFVRVGWYRLGGSDDATIGDAPEYGNDQEQKRKIRRLQQSFFASDVRILSNARRYRTCSQSMYGSQTPGNIADSQSQQDGYSTPKNSNVCRTHAQGSCLCPALECFGTPSPMGNVVKRSIQCSVHVVLSYKLSKPYPCAD